MGIELRDYQARALDNLRVNIRNGIKNQVLVLATGGGKTVIAGKMLEEADRKGKRAVFVVDRISLIDQTSAALDEFDIEHGVMQAQHWRCQPWQRIQVASIQTLARRGWPDADLIIVDECHSLYSDITKRIDRRDTVVIGLSASPFTRGLGKHYDEAVTVTTTNRLIADGFLVPFRVFAASEPDMVGAKTSAGEWTDHDAAERSMPIVGDLVTEYLKHGNDRKFICFGANVAHCEEIQRQFMAAGVVAEVYSYRTPDEARAAMVTEFRKPDSNIRGLISVAALAKGFDVPDVGVIILARPLRNSFAEHIQMLGRGLRISPSTEKTECLILDHSGNCLRFWDRLSAYFETGRVELDDGRRKPKSAAQPKETEARKCPECHHVHDPAPNCPACGHEYPKKASQIRHVAGTLKELLASGNQITLTNDLWPQVCGAAAERGKSKEWALAQYRAMTGNWPRRRFEETMPVPPSPDVINRLKYLAMRYHLGRAKGRR